MSRRRHPHAVYLVYWNDGVLKAGYTAVFRYRKFVALGGRLIGLWYFENSTRAFDAEGGVSAVVETATASTRAFVSGVAAEGHLGTRGDGWLECYRLPKPFTEPELTAFAAHARSIGQALPGCIAVMPSTNETNETNALTLDALPLASEYGALVTRAKERHQ